MSRKRRWERKEGGDGASSIPRYFVAPPPSLSRTQRPWILGNSSHSFSFFLSLSLSFLRKFLFLLENSKFQRHAKPWRWKISREIIERLQLQFCTSVSIVATMVPIWLCYVCTRTIIWNNNTLSRRVTWNANYDTIIITGRMVIQLRAWKKNRSWPMLRFREIREPACISMSFVRDISARETSTNRDAN